MICDTRGQIIENNRTGGLHNTDLPIFIHVATGSHLLWLSIQAGHTNGDISRDISGISGFLLLEPGCFRHSQMSQNRSGCPKVAKICDTSAIWQPLEENLLILLYLQRFLHFARLATFGHLRSVWQPLGCPARL